MEVGFYAGSFDPFTNGHLHVVKKSARLFDKVVIGIGINPNKERRFDQKQMKDAIEKVLIRENLTNVSVLFYNGLTVDAALSVNASFLVRGIRNGVDYDFEENIASINEEVSGLDTVYIRSGNLGNISSSMVMELLGYRDVSKYLPQEVLKVVQKHIVFPEAEFDI